jgi:hypothetical protein
MTAITSAALVAAGYKRFYDAQAAFRLGEWYRVSYSKAFRDEVGTRYILIIRHSVIPERPNARDHFAADNQFTQEGLTFNVEMLHFGESLEAIEALFERLWTTMRLDYYEGGPEGQRHYPQPPSA